MSITTEGVFFSDPVPGSSTSRWGPGGTGADPSYTAGDSLFQINSYGMAGGWDWIRGFGGDNPILNTGPFDFAQDGLDAFDAAWGHVRRLENNGFIYWTPNNSVCWRRPPTFPSDCSTAPAGDNPTTNPGHDHDSVIIADYGETFTAVAYRSDASSDLLGQDLAITCWIGVQDISFAGMQEFPAHAPFNPVPIAGAIEAVPGSVSTGVVHEVQSVRARGMTGTDLDGTGPTVRWYLIEASDSLPAAGPYLIFEAAGGPHGTDYDFWYTAYRREGLEDAVGGWTELTSLNTGDTVGDWIDVDMALIQPGIDAQYARIAALGGTTLHDLPAGDPGPSHFVVGLLDSAQLTDTAPLKDHSNTNAFLLYGYDTGTFVEFEVDIGGAYRYVMYDQPASVPGTPADTIKFGSSIVYPSPGARGHSGEGTPTAYALKNGPAGVEVIDILGWDMNDPGGLEGEGWWTEQHPIKWLGPGNPDRVGVSHRTIGTSPDVDRTDYFTVTPTSLTKDAAEESVGRSGSSAALSYAVTGDGLYYIINHNFTNGVWDLWSTDTAEVKGSFIGTFDLSAGGDGSSISNRTDLYPGPGSTIIGYDYESYLEVYTCSPTGMTYSTVDIPSWVGDGPGNPFTGEYLHRITLEPGTTRIWVVAFSEDETGAFTPPDIRFGYDFYLVAFYDFATATWSNIIEQLADYDYFTYMGDEWGAIGFSTDGPFLTGFMTPNFLDGGDTSPPDPDDNSLGMFAAFLGCHFVRGIAASSATIGWAGDLRKLMYADQGYQGWEYFRYGWDPMSGGIWTGVPFDMRQFYLGADQEMYLQQISALTGSGSDQSTLMINPWDADYVEVAWYTLASRLAALRLLQRDDDYGILHPASNSIRLNTRVQANQSTSQQASARLIKNNPLGYT